LIDFWVTHFLQVEIQKFKKKSYDPQAYNY